MSDLNLVLLSGRITQNADFRISESGKKIADFTIATNLVHKKSDGSYEEVGNFFPHIDFRELREFLQAPAKRSISSD